MYQKEDVEKRGQRIYNKKKELVIRAGKKAGKKKTCLTLRSRQNKT